MSSREVHVASMNAAIPVERSNVASMNAANVKMVM